MDTRIRFAAGVLTGVLLWASVTGALPRGNPNDCSSVSSATNIDGQVVGINPGRGTSTARADNRTNHELQPPTATPHTCPSGTEAAGYKYPYDDPYVATVTSAMLNPTGLTPGIRREVVHVPLLPGRNQLPSLEGRGELSVALYRQDHPAPLLFILSGIGSNPYFGLATYLARVFYQAGSHVVILPSPMSWNFALAASRSGVPGYTPEDARDLYDAMQKTLGVLRDRYDVKIAGINFMGLSLGALEGAYLSVIDAGEQRIGIQKYLLVNPPLDLSYAISRLSEWEGLRRTFGKEKFDRLRAKALATVERSSEKKRGDPTVATTSVEELFRFTRQELQCLIAENVHTVLPELVYVTQAIRDQHVLTTDKDQARRRLQEAKSVKLVEYTERIGSPLWRAEAAEPDADAESLSKQGSLAPILHQLRGNPRVHIMHNADDVLAERRAIEELKETMGDQMTLYPHGGHLGNLWYHKNREDMLNVLGTPS